MVGIHSAPRLVPPRCLARFSSPSLHCDISIRMPVNLSVCPYVDLAAVGSISSLLIHFTWPLPWSHFRLSLYRTIILNPSAVVSLYKTKRWSEHYIKCCGRTIVALLLSWNFLCTLTSMWNCATMLIRVLLLLLMSHKVKVQWPPIMCNCVNIVSRFLQCFSVIVFILSMRCVIAFLCRGSIVSSCSRISKVFKCSKISSFYIQNSKTIPVHPCGTRLLVTTCRNFFHWCWPKRGWPLVS